MASGTESIAIGEREGLWGRGDAGTYLVLDVCEADGKVDGEDDEDDVAFRVAQRSQSVVLFLPCRVPERDLDNLAVELSVCYVVLEHGGYVRLGVAFGE